VEGFCISARSPEMQTFSGTQTDKRAAAARQVLVAAPAGSRRAGYPPVGLPDPPNLRVGARGSTG
jgi:hypothetical protein